MSAPGLVVSKDGSGNLLRIYLDRIRAPEDLAGLNQAATSNLI